MSPAPPDPLEGLATAPGEVAPGIGRPLPPDAPSARRAAVAAALLLVCFLAVTVGIHTSAGKAFDGQLHRFALEHRTAGSVDLARAVTLAGSSTWVLLMVLAGGVLAATGALSRRVLGGALLAATCVLGLLARIGVAHLVGRPRPPKGDWAGAAGGFAFPSGHTTAATLAAGLLAWALARRLRSVPARRGAAVAAVAVALVVGWSRVWLGVHWPTDVLGGWLFAGTWLAAARWVQLRVLPPSAFGRPADSPDGSR